MWSSSARGAGPSVEALLESALELIGSVMGGYAEPSTRVSACLFPYQLDPSIMISGTGAINPLTERESRDHDPGELEERDLKLRSPLHIRPRPQRLLTPLRR
jgi:hypothetical protein